MLITFSACNCDVLGSLSPSCNTSGICSCISENIMGDKCSDCKENFFNFPICTGKYRQTIQ